MASAPATGMHGRFLASDSHPRRGGGSGGAVSSGEIWVDSFFLDMSLCKGANKHRVPAPKFDDAKAREFVSRHF